MADHIGTKKVRAVQCQHIVVIPSWHTAPEWCKAKRCKQAKADLERPTPRNAAGKVATKTMYDLGLTMPKGWRR